MPDFRRKPGLQEFADPVFLSLVIRCRALFFQDIPYLRRRDWDVNIPDAEMPEGIYDSIGDGSRGANCS